METEAPVIKIGAKTLDGKIHWLEVSQSMTVEELKALLSVETEVPSIRQRLIFRGKVLKKLHKLSRYGIQDGFIIHMVERPIDAPESPASSVGTPSPSRGNGCKLFR